MQDIIVHPNVTYIIGNHDYEFFYFAQKLTERKAEEKRMDYYQNETVCVVTGDMPTPLIREDMLPLVYQENCHIAID